MHFVQDITNYILGLAPVIESMGPWIYLIIVGAAVLESTPIVGTFTPGTLFLVFFGFLISVSGLSLIGSILAATGGAVLGDYFGYLLGKYGSRFFKEHNKLLHMGHIDMGRAFFNKHGGKSIFIGRFVGPVRPIVPLVAGAVRMSMRRFLPLNFASAFIWASLLISLGYFVGINWEVVEAWSSRIGYSLSVVIAAAVFFFIKKYNKAMALRRGTSPIGANPEVKEII